MTTASRAGLSRLERAVMELLWERGEVDAAEVREALASERVLADSTVRTLLRRIEAKGFATHRRVDRRYVYRPLVSRAGAAAGSIRETMRRFFHGSVEDLLVGMVDEGILDAEELKALSERIARERGS